MAPERKAEPKLTEAAARTAGVLRALQSRLNREAAAPAEEGLEDLGNQLDEYFAASTEASPSAASPAATLAAPAVAEAPAAGAFSTRRVSNDIRDLVVEGVVDQVLRSWEEPGAGLSALKTEVVERLVERVIAQLSGKGAPSKSTS